MEISLNGHHILLNFLQKRKRLMSDLDSNENIRHLLLLLSQLKYLHHHLANSHHLEFRHYAHILLLHVVVVFPSKNTECLLEGLQRMWFIHMGGVPHTIRFDNLSPAVKKILGKGARENLYFHKSRTYNP